MELTVANPKSSLAAHVAVLLAVVATVLTWVEFLAPIYDGKTVAGDPYALPYYIPSVVVTTVAMLCAFRRSLRGHAAILLILNGAWTLVAKVDNISSWGWIDSLDLVIAAALLVGGIQLARTSSIDINLRRANLVWPSLAGAAAAMWVVGAWLPWISYDTQGQSGQPLASQFKSCCWAFEGGGWLYNLSEALNFGLLVVAALLVASIRQASVSGTGLMALAVLYLDESASWLQGLASPVMSRQDLTDYGFDVDKIASVGATVTQSAAPAGWIALAALTALIAIGIARSRAADHRE